MHCPELVACMAQSAVGHDRALRCDVEAGVRMVTDRSLLRRILENMLSNALEATMAPQAVTLTAHRSAEDRIRIAVGNPGHMPAAVQAQVFQRAFSTKGADRGLGTYAMKLIGEHYLGGSVAFTSGPESGTRFWIDLPTTPPPG